MSPWWSLLIAAPVSLLLTGAIRRYALSRGLIDIPGSRSSHTVPTPRGGGAAIVVCFAVALAAFIAFDLYSRSMLAALLGAGLLIALVGFADDHRDIAPYWRLLVHVAAAVWALLWMDGAPPFSFFGSTVDPGWVGFVCAVLVLVWAVNLYNFMDGIDGIAAVEAICVCGGGALLYVLAGQASLAVLPLVLAAAAAGFLLWNFPPARIFLGDVGSGFLGITGVLLGFQAAWAEPRLLWSWIILLGVFVTDATFTLLRRLLRREKALEAHRSHAYQHASRRFGHRVVTLVVGAIDLVWLLPMAYLVGSGRLEGVLGMIVAYVPLIGLWVWFKGGKPEGTPESAAGDGPDTRHEQQAAP